MSNIIQIADFAGTQYSLPELKYGSYQNYLDKYEKEFLVNLLGADLYNLFIADLDGNGVPQTQRFINIYNSFEIDDDSCVRYSEGMKIATIQYVYFYAVRDLAVKKTNTGVVFNDNENSNGPSYLGFNIVEAYNEAVKNAYEIQWYICDNDEVYPEENVQTFNYSSGI